MIELRVRYLSSRDQAKPIRKIWVDPRGKVDQIFDACQSKYNVNKDCQRLTFLRDGFEVTNSINYH